MFIFVDCSPLHHHTHTCELNCTAEQIQDKAADRYIIPFQIWIKVRISPHFANGMHGAKSANNNEKLQRNIQKLICFLFALNHFGILKSALIFNIVKLSCLLYRHFESFWTESIEIDAIYTHLRSMFAQFQCAYVNL